MATRMGDGEREFVLQLQQGESTITSRAVNPVMLNNPLSFAYQMHYNFNHLELAFERSW